MRKINELTINNERGITLITLITTIIIIVILTGVTVNMLTGDNGLIEETISTKEDVEIQTIEEIANRSYKYLQEESDNALEETVKELKLEGYNIKIVDDIEKEYYVLINGRYYQLLLENNEIKVDRNS